MASDRKTTITTSQIRKHTLQQDDLSPDSLVWQEPVIDKDLTTPPGGESEGDRYLIISGGSGTDFSGHDNDIAQYINGSYSFYTPLEGWMIWIKDEDKLYKFDGSSWSEFTSGAGISNIVEDTTPQLGGDLDLNGKNIDFPTTANISDCLDEDNMVSDSATKLATQQSIKKYVDDNAGGTPIFEEVSSVVRQDDAAAGYDEDFVFGSPQLDDDANSAHDKRFFFDKSKGAFRAGSCAGDEWNDGNRGDYSFGCGYAEKVSGNAAFGCNSGCIASGKSSFASGYFSTASLWGQFAQGGGVFPNAQYSRLVLRADTTDATPEVMYMNKNSSYKAVIPASTAWRVDGVVLATTLNCALSSSWTIKGVIHRDNANNIEFIWNSVTEDVDEIVTAATVTLSADATNKSLEINITGKAATAINWVAYIELAEIKHS